jgi:hypothetical protein
MQPNATAPKKYPQLVNAWVRRLRPATIEKTLRTTQSWNPINQFSNWLREKTNEEMTAGSHHDFPSALWRMVRLALCSNTRKVPTANRKER